MGYAIIQSSQLDLDCWSADRFVGKCYRCDRVSHCKLPEAKPGRLRIAEQRVEAAKLKLAEEKKKLRKCQAELR